MNRKKISIRYGQKSLEAEVPEELLVFTGEMANVPRMEDFPGRLLDKLDHPTGCGALKDLISKNDRILILVEDNTRNTPVQEILPVLIKYLEDAGVPTGNIEILTAPGTHRVMTEKELEEKVGREVRHKIKITQHDFRDEKAIVDLGTVQAGQMQVPVLINKKVQEADFMIGLGNIVPHCDAGFSGGAKIVQPGICGFPTTAATHLAAALLDEIPQGFVENPCRLGMEEVARKVGLNFIINVIKNFQDEVVDVVAGDFVKAHREGAAISQKVYGVQIPELADIVIVSSYPSDIDYWQAEKGVISAYFTVKNGGYIIFVAPCPEGLEHNHPSLRDWLPLSYEEACAKARSLSPYDVKADLISADLAICNARVREKARILMISAGLSEEESKILGYRKMNTLQEAIDFALQNIPDGKIGILPRGGDCLPVLVD